MPVSIRGATVRFGDANSLSPCTLPRPAAARSSDRAAQSAAGASTSIIRPHILNFCG